MMLLIPDVLSKADAADCRAMLDAGPWDDGGAPGEHQQLPPDAREARQVSERVLRALSAHPLFASAALPKKVLRPAFSRHGVGAGFRSQVDSAIRRDPIEGDRLRSDLSAVLFLDEPETYDGGELVVNDLYGEHVVKPGAGDVALYPSASAHRLTTVTRGVRTTGVMWIQSLIRDDFERGLMLDMDIAIQHLVGRAGADDQGVLSLTGVYHNLLRHWAET